MADTQFLQELYDRYLQAAQGQAERRQFAEARNNYLLAAETLVKIAKQTETPKLKAARIEKAKKLVEIADRYIAFGKQRGAEPSKTEGTDRQSGEETDEDRTKWQSAEIPNVHFSDIAGLEDVKETIRIKMIDPFLYPETYQLFHKEIGGGILLYGPPGTGKTMMAKAVAAEVGAKFYVVRSSDIVSKWVGDSEKNIAALFETASQDEKAVIFIDEMDSLFGERGKDPHNDKRVNEFLQQIDGFSNKNPHLLIMGATNRPWDVDAAASRSGRFSVKIYVHLPDSEARHMMFQKALENVPAEESIDLDELVSRSDGFSGADIAECIDRAKIRALTQTIRTNEVERITQEDCLLAINSVLETLDRTSIEQFEAYAHRNAGLLKPVSSKRSETAETKKEPSETGAIDLTSNADAESTVSGEGMADNDSAICGTVAESEFVFDPDASYQLVFALSEQIDSLICAEIEGHKIVCRKKLQNYETDAFHVASDGLKTVKIVTPEGREITRFDVAFRAGIEENDLGI